ncbi:MAG: hypothetical protein E7259_03010 [Lachnospiraceae bacterium]|nr:hypothetical protein [Lachnospiraceae bacterium]
MNKYEKGDYGYINAYKKGKLVISLILAAMISFIVITVIIMYGSTNKVAIVFAILLSMPFAKFLIAYIICAKFNPLNKEQYEYIEENTKTSNSKILYDVTISQYEGVEFYHSLCVKNGIVCALVLDKNINKNRDDYEKWISACVTDDKYEYKIHVFGDIDAYLKKVNSISAPNDNTRIVDKHMTERILDTGV